VAEAPWIHLTATVSPGLPDLTREDVGAWTWAGMREAFPTAIAAVIMPDHPHLIVPNRDARADEQRLRRLLGQLRRRFGGFGTASRVPPAAPIRTGKVLSRQVRYVALNPCRDGLAKCPLEWQWSTHRDVIGATVDPWVTDVRLADALGYRVDGFAVRHHDYVSGDPDASVAGTPFPCAATTARIASVPLRAVAEATMSALRVPFARLQQRGFARALFVALAIDQGWDQTAKLAEACACGEQAIRRLAKDVDEAALRAARLCLGDDRLRRRPPRAPALAPTAKPPRFRRAG
jgi:hypothetical protein